jgi:hypothetical protein
MPFGGVDPPAGAPGPGYGVPGAAPFSRDAASWAAAVVAGPGTTVPGVAGELPGQGSPMGSPVAAGHAGAGPDGPRQTGIPAAAAVNAGGGCHDWGAGSDMPHGGVSA